MVNRFEKAFHNAVRRFSFLQLFFVHASVVSYVAFVLSLFSPDLSFFGDSGAVFRYCGISCICSLILFFILTSG